MVLPLGVRGFNPIWTEFDLTGKIFDDRYYMFVLENTIPYIPKTIWHDPNRNVPWNNPIQFLANGTLPVDIYWDPDEIYRLEFRRGNTQSSPLIYLVENYRPCCEGGINPDEDTGLTSQNEITNPQFSLLSFSPSYTATSVTGSIEVAPGWFLDLTGTGNVTLNRVAINSAVEIDSNSPYALQINTSGGFTAVQLRQRFNQNGILWANKTISSTVTARVDGAAVDIRATLVDSLNNELVEVLASTTINSSYTQYKGHGTLDASTNTDIPPDAYIDYVLHLPTTVNIFVTSFQLIVQDATDLTEYTYIQDTLERQVDHTFHYYRDSLLLMPKDSVLAGWQFALNPFQFETTTVTDTTAKCQYICDQTIIYTTGAAGAVSTGLSSTASGVRQNLTIQANTTASNQFALIQYIDPATIRQYWSYRMSALVRCKRFNDEGTPLGIKMRLIYRTTLPSTIGNVEPILSWAGPGTDPVFAAGWTAIIPQNDPTYEIRNDYDILTGARAFFAYPFENMQMPLDTTDDMTLAIVVYTTANMDNDPIVNESIAFDTISLVPNEFAIEANPKTYDEVLRECEFYYETSYDRHILPGTALANGGRMAMQLTTTGIGSVSMLPATFGVEYRTMKREGSPTVLLYAPVTGTSGSVSSTGVNSASDSFSVVDYSVSTNYTQTGLGAKNVVYVKKTLNTGGTLAASPVSANGYITYHYTIDARLGR